MVKIKFYNGDEELPLNLDLCLGVALGYIPLFHPFFAKFVTDTEGKYLPKKNEKDKVVAKLDGNSVAVEKIKHLVVISSQLRILFENVALPELEKAYVDTEEEYAELQDISKLLVVITDVMIKCFFGLEVQKIKVVRGWEVVIPNFD